jgi:two-component system LytT family sensor kinase
MVSINSQWYTRKWVLAGLHTLFWILFLVSPYLLTTSFEHRPGFDPAKLKNNVYLMFLLGNVLRPVVFYLNAWYFIPKLVYTRRIKRYSIVLVVTMLLLLGWDQLLCALMLPGLRIKMWSYSLLELPTFIFLIMSSTALRVIADKIKQQQTVRETETENLKTELSFLRSQVSPHFMFNVLNNMVALARKKSDLLEPSLIKLSSLLRYMLYETDEDKVLVEKEIEYLKSYIELQSQRFGKKVEIVSEFEPVTDGHIIEPMLLIPFVENAFKHGTGLVANAQITISLKLADGQLHFQVRNRYNETVQWEKDKTSGIGLTNVKRRLNLLYPDSHTLRIDREGGWFSVLLKLNLH